MSLASAGTWLFRYRNVLVPFALVLVLVPGPHIAADPLVPMLAGAVLVALGQLLRALTIGLKYIVRGGRNRRVFAEDLVTDGLFAHTRNPLYLGNLGILAGIAIASNSWVCVALAVALGVFVYSAIVAAEEEYLRGRFGARYEAYAAVVPRWRVRIAGLGETVRASEFHWRRLVTKEYGTTAAWLLAFSLTAWHSLERSAAHSGAEWPRTILLTCIVLTAAFWITARWLKKSGIVVAD